MLDETRKVILATKNQGADQTAQTRICHNYIDSLDQIQSS